MRLTAHVQWTAGTLFPRAIGPVAEPIATSKSEKKAKGLGPDYRLATGYSGVNGRGGGADEKMATLPYRTAVENWR